jgi:uncharacterized membrane protein YfcA
MQIYLPIAELSVHILALLALGGVAGLLSGLFGIGGGFILTPFLIFLGVPPAVAVASCSNQIIASSFSGFLAHWRKHNVDFRMGSILLVGGMGGSMVGVSIFDMLKTLGQIDLFISISYVVFLTSIGSLMAYESWGVIFGRKKHSASKERASTSWVYRWPLQMDFPKSKMRITAILPMLVGVASGMLVSLMGIGGGFVMIPAMVYILHMPSSMVVGTSLFQIIFITALVTFMHAITTQSVDITLALLLVMGSVIGAQIGSHLSTRVSAIHLRGLLAATVLAVSIRLAYGLVITPDQIFTLSLQGGM